MHRMRRCDVSAGEKRQLLAEADPAAEITAIASLGAVFAIRVLARFGPDPVRRAEQEARPSRIRRRRVLFRR